MEETPAKSSPTVLERIVGVIPTPFKVALGALCGLLLIALAATRRTQVRLRDAELRAATDALTGLPNRRHGDEVIERLMSAARRNRRPLAVILFDLDRFKAINDNFGHGTGDEVLRVTAEVTRELLRGGDHVVRFGGEEFVVLLPETSRGDAAFVADKIRGRLAEKELPALAGGFFTASFGVAAFPEDGAGTDELLRSADEALYRAKGGGRNRVEEGGTAEDREKVLA